MKQYIEMVQTIKQKGTYKPAAREGMPGTTSLFGYQFRHNLADGFPLLTTKQVPWKGVVTELIWFLKGDTNIKFLDENNVRYMWHEDAYNYYIKQCKKWKIQDPLEFEGEVGFLEHIKQGKLIPGSSVLAKTGYRYGDCGKQYGSLWRDWEGVSNPQVLSIKTDNLSQEKRDEFKIEWERAMMEQYSTFVLSADLEPKYINKGVDQIKELIEGLTNNPMSRRHIISAWNPATLDDMALNACHALAQWNCRPLSFGERFNQGDYKPYNIEGNIDYLEGKNYITKEQFESFHHNEMDKLNIPKYYLDCQMYQRSADVFLGVPLNIASYALLTEILCKICNMIPGEMIYTYGDVHIYDNHKEQIELQLTREEKSLPKLHIVDEGNDWATIRNLHLDFFGMLGVEDFKLEGYDPHPSIKGKLSTGLK